VRDEKEAVIEMKKEIKKKGWIEGLQKREVDKRWGSSKLGIVTKY
jgi:hypothetical protein